MFSHVAGRGRVDESSCGYPQRRTNEKFRRLRHYPVDRWRLASAAVEPLRQWRPCTNNHLEGWHNRLKQLVRKAHPTLYMFLAFLQKEQHANETLHMQYAASCGKRQMKWRRYRNIDSRLTGCVDEKIGSFSMRWRVAVYWRVRCSSPFGIVCLCVAPDSRNWSVDQETVNCVNMFTWSHSVFRFIMWNNNRG